MSLPHTAHMTFPRELAAVQPAREAVRQAAEGAHPDEDTGWAVELMVAELVANAVLHAADPVDEIIEVDLIVDPHRIEVAVIDHGSRPFQPQVAMPAAPATSGRGLALIARLADTWGIDRSAACTRVWFTLRLA